MNSTRRPLITLIAAVGPDRELGRNGDLVYHIREDMRHFKATTMGHPVVMGRKTFESFPNGALPGRRNIVITTNSAYSAPSIETVGSIDNAIALAADADEIMIIGGGRVYDETIAIADRLILTEVAAPAPDADTFFPSYADGWLLESATDPTTDPATGLTYRFATYRRP